MKLETIQQSRKTAFADIECAKESMATLRDIKRETDRQALAVAVREALVGPRDIMALLREAGVAIWPELQAAHEGAINEARALGINLGNDHGPSPQEAQAAKQALSDIGDIRDMIADLKEALANPDVSESTKQEYVEAIGEDYNDAAGIVHRLIDVGAAPPDLLEAFAVIQEAVIALNAAHAFWPELGNIEAAPEPRQLEEPAHALAAPDHNHDCWLPDNHTHVCNIPAAGAQANHSWVESE